jgi:hypothetical protein
MDKPSSSFQCQLDNRNRPGIEHILIEGCLENKEKYKYTVMYYCHMKIPRLITMRTVNTSTIYFYVM